MRQNEFRELLGAHPELAHYVYRYADTHMEPLAEWVEGYLDSITILPWEKLDLAAVATKDVATWTCYAVHYHIGKQERLGARVQWVEWAQFKRRNKSVAETVDGLFRGHGERKYPKLVIDAVTRKIVNDSARRSGEAITLWLAPENLQLRS